METILLITGTRAYQDLRALDLSSLTTKYKFIYHKAKLDVAAFLSISRLESILAEYEEDKGIDWILVSGLIPSDLSRVSSSLASKLRKGPKFLHNLAKILQTISPEKLSQEFSAEKILDSTLAEDYQKVVARVKKDLKSTEDPLKKFSSFALSDKHPNILFSPYTPSVLLAEIVDAPRLSFEKLDQYILHYLRNGADIIDLGCISNLNSSDFLEDTIPALIQKYDVPFSIDSVNPQEIHAAINAGAEMALSIDEGNFLELLDLPKDIPIVLIPTNSKEGHCPETGQERIEKLINLGRILTQEGFSKILLDPLLEPPIQPGLSRSLDTYSILHNALQNLPKTAPQPQLFMGVGNITELVDADSPGMNALLSIIAKELGVAGLLSTEYSAKSRNSIRELRKGIDLAFIADHYNAPPLNLGLDAFITKAKTPHLKSPFFKSQDACQVPTAHTDAIMDPRGFFKIYVEFKAQRIIVEHYLNSKPDNAENVFYGQSAEAIYKHILSKDLVSLQTHCAYLGKELAKAESSLHTGSSYVQDE